MRTSTYYTARAYRMRQLAAKMARIAQDNAKPFGERYAAVVYREQAEENAAQFDVLAERANA